MATNFIKHMSMTVAVALAMLSSVYALENADVLKLVADLKSENPKVRAKAITELTPLYMEIESLLKSLKQDKDPNVQLAFMAFSNKMAQKYVKSPEGLDAQLRVNEVYAVACCRAYLTAQDIYKRTDYNKDGVLEYAKSLKGDGSLFENKTGAGDVMMIDKAFANAEGNPDKAVPKNGYCFKVLTKQGENAVGGSKSYIKDGHMIYGHALLAYPAEYGVTGKNCIIVSSTGVKENNQVNFIFRKDLGPKTSTLIESFDEFNPDKTWNITE